MKIEFIEFAQLMPAPWRFSENISLPHGVGKTPQRFFSPIQHNIALSLQRDGQIAPIHVRYTGGLDYQTLDGHIVVDAAKQVGMTGLNAIVHRCLTEQDAMRLYILLNLNRCGQYGHYHVKIHRTFKKLWPELSKEQKTELLCTYLSWPPDRVQDYVELSEQDETWQKFMFVPADEESTAGHTQGMFDMGETKHEVRDDQ